MFWPQKLKIIWGLEFSILFGMQDEQTNSPDSLYIVPTFIVL